MTIAASTVISVKIRAAITRAAFGIPVFLSSWPPLPGGRDEGTEKFSVFRRRRRGHAIFTDDDYDAAVTPRDCHRGFSTPPRRIANTTTTTGHKGLPAQRFARVLLLPTRVKSRTRQ
ncbi:unnamed protein product [Macrosiphum euphorbiae]|uniref:Secreted protein n=1 Tax=Macrosiphum euphorbiae TaxID=13131 RepID=A0AAV0X2T2_9HEMI|nr:unnamed protein product [Macrosiphum euphorbiae]